MAVTFASAYRTTNWAPNGWAAVSGYTVETDPAGLLDATGNLEFTALGDGLLIWQNSVKWTDPNKSDTLFNRHYIDGAIWPTGWANRYNGGLVGHEGAYYQSTCYAHIPMSTAEVHRTDYYASHFTHTLLGGQNVQRIQYLWVPDSDGIFDVMMVGKSANQGPFTAGATWHELTGFDRPMSSSEWVGVDEKTFTVPADGYIIAHFHSQDSSTNLNQQRQHMHIKPDINSDGGLQKNEGGRKYQQSTYQQYPTSPIIPVSSGDEIVWNWAFESFGSDQYTIKGYNDVADGIDYASMAIKLFV
jgi:hypothetical protein